MNRSFVAVNWRSPLIGGTRQSAAPRPRKREDTGEVVWTSGKNLKPWRLNEGLRKVHFKQGLNRVLYRVENGNNITEFSLVLSLQP